MAKFLLLLLFLLLLVVVLLFLLLLLLLLLLIFLFCNCCCCCCSYGTIPEYRCLFVTQVLHDFSNYLLATVGSEELQEATAAQVMASMRDAGISSAAAAAAPIRASKRNSELLNSLLGLPKNILKSGRK